MQQHKQTYQNYLTLHQDFNQEHRIISKQITDLYQAPKKFMEENEKAIQSCLSGKKNDGTPHHAELSYNSIRDFLFIVEDFKLQTMELFFEHRVHIDKCTIYVVKVSDLQKKFEGKEEAEGANEYIQLIPQLEDLRAGLICLLDKAEIMITNLKEIEERWSRISSKV
ncbi:MAG: hypothetical protein V4615_03770 [Bacteroidota bacterium]